MKTLRVMIRWILAFQFVCSVDSALAETFSEKVSTLWLNGKWEEVKAMSQSRLDKDTNDLAGLLLKMEYEINFMQVNSLTVTFERFMSAQKDITTNNYSKVRSRLEWDRRMIINQIPTITAEMLKEDEHKAYITNKPLVYAKLIHALEADGLIPPIAKDNPGNPPISERPNKPADSPPQKTGSLLLPVLLGFIGAIAILFAFWRRKK